MFCTHFFSCQVKLCGRQFQSHLIWISHVLRFDGHWPSLSYHLGCACRFCLFCHWLGSKNNYWSRKVLCALYAHEMVRLVALTSFPGSLCEYICLQLRTTAVLYLCIVLYICWCVLFVSPVHGFSELMCGCDVIRMIILTFLLCFCIWRSSTDWIFVHSFVMVYPFGK